jgi:hypothetical protein
MAAVEVTAVAVATAAVAEVTAVAAVLTPRLPEAA